MFYKEKYIIKKDNRSRQLLIIFYNRKILNNLEYNKKYFLQVIVNNGNGDIIETYTGNFIIENKPSRQVEISNTEKTNYKKYTEVHENRDRDFSRDNDKDSINSSIYRASGYGSMEKDESNDDFDVEDEYELEIRYDYKAQEIYAPEGGRWVPDRGSSGPDGLNRQVRQITYLPYDIAVALKDTMNNIEVVDYLEAFAEGVVTNSGLMLLNRILDLDPTKATKVIQLGVSVYVGVISFAADNADREELQEVINRADEDEMIRITTTIETRYGPLPGSTPTTRRLNYYEVWPSNYIEGEIGYKGDFDKNEYLPWDIDEESLEIMEKIKRMN